jgi:hypothetical protein
MPLPQEIQEELERKRREEHVQAERDSFWAHVRTALACVAWSALGLALMAWGLHTSDPELGQVAWKGGIVVGYAGILFTLIRAHATAKDRGDV